MTRDRESLHVGAATDGDAAVAVAWLALAHGVRDEYDDLSVNAHGLDNPLMWTEATYTTEQPSVWRNFEVAFWSAVAVVYVILGIVWLATLQLWGNG